MSKDSILRYRIIAENDQLKRDLAKAKGQLNRFKNQSRGISKAIKTQLIGMFGVFTAGAIFHDIGRTIAGFEKQMDKVAAISGATEKEVSRLKNSAIELGRASKFTAIEIGQLQEELARLGFSSSQIIDSTDAIRKLATAADSELNEAAKTVAATLNSFGMEAKEAGEISNIMAESFSKSALDLEKFSVGMSNVGATANAAGISIADTTSMLGILSNSGIDASKAGTDLRKIFTELAVKGITLEDALAEIRGSADKVKTSFELFGQRASTSAIILAENEQAAKTLSSTLSDTNKELDGMVEIMEDNLITDLQKLKSAWDGFILSLENGEGVGTNALRGLAKGFTDLLNGLSNWEAFTKGSGLKFLPGTSPDDKAALKEFQRIIDGISFDNISIETMEYAEAVKTLDSRLAAFKQNKHYEKIKDSVDEYKEELKKANKEQERQINLINQQVKAFKDLQASTPNTDNLSSVGVSINPLSNSELGLGALSGRGQLNHSYYEGVKEKMKKDFEDFSAFLQAQADQLNVIVNDTLGNAIASGLQTFLDTGDVKQGFAALLKVIGDGLINLGKTLIAFGVAIEAFKKAPGPAKIVAGLAAIAAGVLVSKAASSLSASSQSGISGGGGSSGPSGSFQNNLTGQTVKVEGEIIANGKDLKVVFDEQVRLESRGL